MKRLHFLASNLVWGFLSLYLSFSPIYAQTSIRDNRVETFREGYLFYQMDIEDKVLKKLTEYVRQQPNSPMDAMKQASKKLSQTEIAYLQKLSANNPELMMSLILLPLLGSEITVKGSTALAEAKGLTYTLQNLWDQQTGKGVCHIFSSIHPENQFSYQTDKKFKEENKALVKIDGQDFDRLETNESIIISGFKTVKIIYNRKKSAQSNVPCKLEIYTSPQLSNVVNFSHPYYMDEGNGIVKIKAYLSERMPPVVYELVQIKRVAIPDSDLKIPQDGPVLPTNTLQERAALGFRILGIMLNTGKQPDDEASNED